MLEALINGSNLEKGLFVTLVGMLGVFIVLTLFYLIIRTGIKVLQHNPEKNGEQ